MKLDLARFEYLFVDGLEQIGRMSNVAGTFLNTVIVPYLQSDSAVVATYSEMRGLITLVQNKYKIKYSIFNFNKEVFYYVCTISLVPFLP